jgi:hypothetical protein
MKILPVTLVLSVLVTTALAQPTFTDFRFEVQNNAGKISENIIADIYGDTLIVGIIPSQQTDFSLKATYTTAATSVKVDGVDQQSTVTTNDFSSAVTYVISSGGDARTYKVKLIYTGLSLVYVYTQDATPITSKDDYLNATLKIYPNDGSAVYTGTTKVKGRGNTTWTLPKKPYRLKLDSKASILGMPSDKDWVLLANYSDKTLMRNSLAYDLGSQMNFAYTQRSTHVDLILNGRFQGNYVIGEHIKVDDDRVNIKEMEPEDIDGENVTGGYFLELDDYRDGIYFELGSGLPFVMKSPDEDIPQEQMDYIKSYMQATEDVIFSDDFGDPENGYKKYINPETFIEWYWVMEVLKNIDAQDVSSIYYYKDRGEKLNMGPLWDLDVSAGNASINGGDDPTGFYVRESKWFKRLFEDSAFRATAEARWFTFKDELLVNLPQMIDGYAGKLHVSQQQNFYRWDILNQVVWPSPVVVGSYEGEVGYLKNWMADRIAWIDSQIERPEVDAIGVPVLHSPVANATVETLYPTIKWYSANLADGYDLQVSLNNNFETPVLDKTGLSDTTYSVTDVLIEETTYYWRVRSVNADGQSAWSEVGSFATPRILAVGNKDFGVSMFPNPTSKELYIEVASHASIESAHLVDALGRTAASSSLTPGVTTTIDVSGLQRGLYVLVLRGKMNETLTHKILLH